MTEKQQERLHVCENNWVRRIADVKRIDNRRMEGLREEVGVRESRQGKNGGAEGGSWCERERERE